MSTWLITGCSTGLGRSLAEAVIGAGHNTVVTARHVTRVADLSATAPDRVLAVALDVTNADQVISAVQQARRRLLEDLGDLVLQRLSIGAEDGLHAVADLDHTRGAKTL